MKSTSSFPRAIPPQHQRKQPGIESEMHPRPIYDREERKGSNKLQGKIALITGGDSGIGRAVAIAFAKEGADVAIVYFNETSDAQDTKRHIEALGQRCLLLSGDVGEESFCQNAIERIIKELGALDILVNNAAEQHVRKHIEDISSEQLERTFRTNLFSMFYLTKAALPHLKKDSCIINTASVTAYKGSQHLVDYSASKGAVVTFTRSLSQLLASHRIRVNGVAPGPIWTPLIPSSMPADEVPEFGKDVPLGRPGQPVEVAQCYVFLASADASYMTGQILHPNGGILVNG